MNSFPDDVSGSSYYNKPSGDEHRYRSVSIAMQPSVAMQWPRVAMGTMTSRHKYLDPVHLSVACSTVQPQLGINDLVAPPLGVLLINPSILQLLTLS